MGWFRPVHFKSPPTQEVRALLKARKQLPAKMGDIERNLRGLLRGFGLKVGEISKGQFAARVRTLTAGYAMLEKIARAMLRAREALQKEFARLHRAMLSIARDNEVCRRLMSVPGAGALIAVTFTPAVDHPERFSRWRVMGAHFGLTPKKYQSGEFDIMGAVSRVGDPMARATLYEGGQILLTRAVRFSALKCWVLEVAERRGIRQAKVALARKLAVILHRIWMDSTTFRWGWEEAAAQEKQAFGTGRLSSCSPEVLSPRRWRQSSREECVSTS